MKLSLINENLEAKRKYLLKTLTDNEISDPAKANEIINWIAKADPIAVKSNDRKTPFINQILKWYLNNKIRLPEDIETVRSALEKYSIEKSRGKINKNIEDFDSPGGLRLALNDENGDSESYDKNATLIDTDGEFKLYRIDTWEQGLVCFKDSGWCVQNKPAFDGYKPPYYMAIKGKKRYALMHTDSQQIKDVHDNPLSIRLGEPIKKWILKLFPKIKFTEITENNEDEDEEIYTIIEDNDLIEFIDWYPKDKKELFSNNDLISLSIDYALKHMTRIAEVDKTIIRRYYVISGGTSDMKYIEHKTIEYISKLIGRWPELEDTMLKYANIRFPILYARDIIKGRWSELEQKFLKPLLDNHQYYVLQHYGIYIREVIKGRWPELEELINNVANGNKKETMIKYYKELLDNTLKHNTI